MDFNSLLSSIRDRISRQDSELIQRMHHYASEPATTLEERIASRRRRLAGSVSNKLKIYLDTRYWIFMRDAKSDRLAPDPHRQIYRRLTKLVSTGRAICPVSDMTLDEVANIGSRTARIATAATLDELSQSVAICHRNRRIRDEFYALWSSTMGRPPEPYKNSDNVWTFPAFAFGDSYLRNPSQSGPGSNAFLALLFDELAELKCSQSIEMFYNNPSKSRRPLETWAADANRAASARSGPAPAFPTLAKQEIFDFLRAALIGADGKIRHAEPLGELSARPAVLDLRDQAVLDFIVRLIKGFAQGNLADRFPYLEVMIGLNALSRRGTQSTEGNDLADMDHACAALPYCDAFLTEKGLATRITQKPLALDAKYACVTLSKEHDVLSYLESIG